MSEQTNLNENGLTDAQEKEVCAVFGYVDEYEINEADLERAREMFKTPEDFKLLRKMLGIHTPNEMGITYKSPHKLHQAELENKEAWAIETAVSQLADERIRSSLLGFYASLRGHIQIKMSEKFKAANDTKASEAKNSEEFQEEQEEAKRKVGTQL